MRATGKKPMQFVFNALGAGAQELNFLARALGTDGRNFLRETAQMAQHAAITPMVREHNGTVLAEQAVAAGAADHETGKAAPV